MRGTWRAAGAVVVAAVVVGPAAGARADEGLRFSGALTYAWHGDRSRGCAADGLCGVRGAVIIRPGDGSSLSSQGGPQTIDFGGLSETVRVLRQDAGQTRQACVDTPGAFGSLTLFSRRVRRGIHELRFEETAPSSGRCAGPLEAELARIPLRARFSRGRQPTRIDMRMGQAFSAGPFSGELTSTLVARPDPTSGSGSSSSSSFSSSSPPGPVRKQLFERVDLQYVAQLRGSLVTSLAGSADASCTVRDSCGLSGSERFSASRLASRIEFFGERVVHRRVGRPQALADARSGRLPLFPSGPVDAIGQVSESLTRAGGFACQDASGTRAMSIAAGDVQTLRPARGSIAFTLGNLGYPVPGWRTHCPGPLFGDVFGSSGTMARSRLPLAMLGERTMTITLTPSDTPFAAPGYTGSSGGAIQLILTLARARVGTLQRVTS